MSIVKIAVLGLLAGGAAPNMSPHLEPVPIGDMANWEDINDYPSRAIREQLEGTTGFRLTIGIDGRVLDCHIINSSGYNILDIATCDIIRRRGRFASATDDKGKPIQGIFESARIWRLPPTRDIDF